MTKLDSLEENTSKGLLLALGLGDFESSLERSRINTILFDEQSATLVFNIKEPDSSLMLSIGRDEDREITSLGVFANTVDGSSIEISEEGFVKTHFRGEEEKRRIIIFDSSERTNDMFVTVDDLFCEILEKL